MKGVGISVLGGGGNEWGGDRTPWSAGEECVKVTHTENKKEGRMEEGEGDWNRQVELLVYSNRS